MIAPRLTRPRPLDIEEKTGVYTCFSTGPEMFGTGTLPAVIGAGTNLESDVIVVQGFNSFQVWLATVGAGTFNLSYGICHPVNMVTAPPSVVGYRTLLSAVATAPSTLATFGSIGQTVLAFQGDLYTGITLRVGANGASVTLQAAILWASVR